MDQRLAAGEEHAWHAELREIVDRRAKLRERQLAGIVPRGGVGVTVRAAQVAAARDVPDDDRFSLRRRARSGVADAVAERIGGLSEATVEDW
jgi:hypothetical protein